MSLSSILLLSLISGPIGWILITYILGALWRWTGSWFGGQASSEEVRAAIAWSAVPTIIAEVFWIPQLILVGKEMFTSLTPRIDSSPLLILFLLGISIIQIILASWTMILQFKCLGEVHGFSAWKAVAASLLGAIILFVPIFFIAVLVSGIRITVTP